MLKQVQHDKKSLDSRFRGNDIKNLIHATTLFRVGEHRQIQKIRLYQAIEMTLYNGRIAQLVEQRTENPCVAGSIPASATTSILNACLGFLWYIVTFIKI